MQLNASTFWVPCWFSGGVGSWVFSLGLLLFVCCVSWRKDENKVLDRQGGVCPTFMGWVGLGWGG